MTPTPTHLRIHVAPDGVVEFSVALTGTTDPSVIANMVSAVRAGMIAPPPLKPPPPPQQSAPSCSPLPANTASTDAAPSVSSHPHAPQSGLLSPAPEPSSDPDPEPTRPDQPQSSSLTQPVRKLSVLDIAAQFDAAETRRSLHLCTTSAEQDDDMHHYEHEPVREFSSSPALWLTGGTDAFVDSLHTSLKQEHPVPSSTIVSDTVLRTSSAQDDEEHRSLGQPPRIQHSCGTSTSPIPTLQVPPTLPAPDSTNKTPHLHAHVDTAPSFVSGPIRMLSLPVGSRHDDVNDMYFGDVNTGGAREVATIGSHGFRHLDADTAAILTQRDAHPGQKGEEQPLGQLFISPADRVRDRRDRVAKMTSARQPPNRSIRRMASDLNKSTTFDDEQDPHAVPPPQYVQHTAQQEEMDENDAWDNVEYELTDSYREDVKHAEDIEPDNRRGRSYHRSAAWRLFSSIGSSLGKKRMEAEDDIYQSTLAPGNAVYKTEKTLGKARGPLRRAGGYRFGRGGAMWLEFSSPVDVERMVSEVGKITKALGFRVLRRPGENKLQCVRWLTHRQEMHVVIIVSSIGLPQGSVSVVRLKRARGDRNRTEVWRYSQFYRELIERLQRSGIEIISEM